MGLFDTSKKQNQKDEIVSLQRDLTNATAFIKELEQKVQKERAQSAKSAATTLQEINRLRNLLQSTQDERRTLQIDVNSFHGELQSTRLASERLITDITARDQQIQALKQTLSRIPVSGFQGSDDYNVVIKAQGEELQRLEADLDHRERNIEDALRRARHAIKLRDEAHEKIERQLEEINDKDHILDSLRAKLRSKDEELNQTKLAIEDSTQQLGRTSKARDDARTEMDRQSEELETKSRLINVLRQRLEDKEVECAELDADSSQYQAQIRELEIRTRNLEELREAVQEKEEECAEKDSRLAQFETLAAELISKTGEIAYLQERLENAAAESEAKDTYIVDQGEQVQEEKRKTLLVRQDMLKYRRESEQFQAHLEKLQVRMTEEETRWENERAKLRAVQQRLTDEEHSWEQERRTQESELHQSRERLRQAELAEVELVQKSAQLTQKQAAISELENALEELTGLIETKTREAEQQAADLNSSIEAKTRELDEQTEANHETRLALNRTRNELNNETRKARLATQAEATISRQMEYVQQQCAVLQEKLTELQAREADEKTHSRETAGKLYTFKPSRRGDRLKVSKSSSERVSSDSTEPGSAS